jgi:RNA 2',3'-cyclic 3'-phosphodiesterase
MRLFIALNLPGEERERIHAAAAPLREAGFPVRWLDPENFHLTLKFLGDVRSEMLPVVEKVVRNVAGQTAHFPLSLGGFGAFPTIRRPRVIWIGATPTPALRCLKQDIEWGLASHGFERETRAFHPHITLGRADEQKGAGAFRGLDELSAGLGYSSVVPLDTVELMRSHLSRKGARYTVVQSSPLKDRKEAVQE